jgi:hypothetical protein
MNHLPNHPPPDPGRRGDRLDFEDVPENLQPHRRLFPSWWALGVIVVLFVIGAAIGVFVVGGFHLLLGSRQ